MGKKYSIDETTLNELGDIIRKNTGTTGKVEFSDIKSQVENGIDTSDATATAETIFKDETAYADGKKLTGTFTIDSELTTQDNLISQIQTALQGKASASEPVLQSKTATPSTSAQTIKPDSGYDGLSQVTVSAMPTATQATPSISVSSSGLITASATQTAGYVTAGTKSATKQLTTQAAKTITPSTSSQTAVASGVYTTGAVTVVGDANLVAANIAEGVSIFGVTGTHSGGSSGGGGSVETCTVTISMDGPPQPEIATIYYTDASTLTVKSITTQETTLTVPTNTIVAITGWTSMSESSGSCNQLYYGYQYSAYQITGNCTLTYLG